MDTTTALPTTTTARLLAVADAIDAHPEQWDQSDWVSSGGVTVPTAWQGHGAPDCGTRCCVAGWAVALTPVDVDLPDDWQAAGAVSLGLERDLARAIFAAAYAPADMPGVLRTIATIPEGERTVRAAVAARVLDWRSANLTGANLTDANLTGANLTDANLTRANLTRADLTDADLTAANLTAAWRLPTDPPAPGWTLTAAGWLVREATR